MEVQLAHSDFVDERRRFVTLIATIDALDRSGIRPVTSSAVHCITYLANALAPVWGLQPFDGAVLKHGHQPYYPTVQEDLESLVGMGIVSVDRLFYGPSVDGKKANQLQGAFALNRLFADAILEALKSMPDEAVVVQFLLEVGQAYSRLIDDDPNRVMLEDATYGDRYIDTGQVIDLGEWIDANSTASSNVLSKLSHLAGRNLKPAEAIEIYVDHMARRLANGQG